MRCVIADLRLSPKEVGMENLLKRFFVFTVVSGSVILLLVAKHFEIDLELTIIVSSALTIGLVYFLEKKIPFRSTWNENAGDLRTDIYSAATLIILVEPFIKTMLPVVIIVTYEYSNVAFVKITLPFFIQVLLVTLMAEFGKYWSHRLHHKYQSLWWLHALHHSSKRLYFLNNLRIHPVNYLINTIVGLAPVMIIGFSSDAILGYLLLTQPLVLIQHANIDLKSSCLNFVFSTNEVHRWHHSTIPSEANRNYGNALLIWDHVFRTFKNPDGFSKEKQVGLFFSHSCYPENASYWEQVKSVLNTPR